MLFIILTIFLYSLLRKWKIWFGCNTLKRLKFSVNKCVIHVLASNKSCPVKSIINKTFKFFDQNYL